MTPKAVKQCQRGGDLSWPVGELLVAESVNVYHWKKQKEQHPPCSESVCLLGSLKSGDEGLTFCAAECRVGGGATLPRPPEEGGLFT